jgi:hypothetical protein
MAERDYRAQPVSDALGLRAVIDGLASDLQDMRAGRITPPEGMARAALAKQLFAGVRLYLVAHQVAAGRMGAPQDVTPPSAIADDRGEVLP